MKSLRGLVKHFRTGVVRLSVILVVFVFLIFSARPALANPSQADIDAIFGTSNLYDPGSANCSTSNASDLTSAPSAGVWNSGRQAPYYMEAFAIETLKDIASKLGVAENTVVTQQHVVTMIGWMWIEGGGLTNPNAWNPLNTGLNDPELLATKPDGSGHQGFKSFDAGVEATTRAIVEPQYSRLTDVLKKPDSTGGDFVHALTYYQDYPGNKIWAEASMPGYGGNPNAQQDYYNTVLGSVQQASQNYSDEASLIITEAGFAIRADQHVPTTQLKFNNGSVSVDVGASPNSNNSCGASGSGGIVAGNVAQTAINFSWMESYADALSTGSISNEPGRNGPKYPKPEFAAAMQKFNPGSPYGGADCGAFVATVMRSSGADPNYPLVGTINQGRYVIAHPEKYDIQYQVTSTSELQPGDILIVNRGSHLDSSGQFVIPDTGDSGSGHTMLYVGPQGPLGNSQASASLDERAPNLGKPGLDDKRGFYMRVRLKQ